MKKILTIFLVFTILYGSNPDFTRDINTKLKGDFYKLGITYDPTSSKIVFNESEMLFKNGSAEINKPFKYILNYFFPRYLAVVLKHKDNIEKIIIKGHTSSNNSKGKTLQEKYMLNKVLSQKRADKFLAYAKSIDNLLIKENKDWIDKTFEAIGVSSSQPIYDKNHKEDKEASRRIEIEIVFKNELKSILSNPDIKEFQDEKDIHYLSTYVKKLLEKNPTIAEKYHILKALQADIQGANAAFRPTATLNFKQTKYLESDPDKKTDMQSKDITIRYNLFNGFKDLSEEKIQKYSYRSNQYLKKQIENDLVYSLAEAFITIKKQKDVLELSKTNLEDYDIWIAKEDIKFQNGLTSLKDYAKVQSRDIGQRMNYEELTRVYNDSVDSLKQYIEFSTKDIENFEELNPTSKYLENTKLAFDDMELYSPYIKEAKANITLYKEKKKQVEVTFYPRVDFVAKKSILDTDYEELDSKTTKETTLSLEATLAFYSGGKDEATYKRKLFEYRQKLDKLQSVKNDMTYRLRLAINKYKLTFNKEDLLLHLIAKREDSLLGASYDYKFAKIDANALLDAVDDLYNAKKLYIENRYDRQIAEYKILSMIGIIKDFILTQDKE